MTNETVRLVSLSVSAHKNMLHTKLTNREIIAVIVTALLLVIGVFLGWNYEPEWLNRAGTLIIVVGVIFAVTDLPEALERRVRSIQRITNALVFNSWLAEQEEQKKEIFTPSQLEALRSEYNKLNEPETERKSALPKKRFLFIEAAIICIGTIVNGFGDWAIKTIICS